MKLVTVMPCYHKYASKIDDCVNSLLSGTFVGGDIPGCVF